MRHPKRRLKKYWINVYRITRQYGGPEEGGWWYNDYELLHSVHVLARKADAVVTSLVDEWVPKSWGNIYSVRGGEEFAVEVEDHKGESETKERPYYS